MRYASRQCRARAIIGRLPLRWKVRSAASGSAVRHGRHSISSGPASLLTVGRHCHRQVTGFKISADFGVGARPRGKVEPVAARAGDTSGRVEIRAGERAWLHGHQPAHLSSQRAAFTLAPLAGRRYARASRTVAQPRRRHVRHRLFFAYESDDDLLTVAKEVAE